MPFPRGWFEQFFTPQARRRRFGADAEMLVAYFSDLHALNVPLLTKEQEVALLERARNHEQEARKLLVEANLRLVIRLALTFQGRGLPLCELIQEGNLGLLEAIARFDHGKAGRLSTYAKFWIIKYLQAAIERQSRVVPLSTRNSAHLRRIEQVLSESQAQGINLSTAQIAQATHLSAEQVSALLPLVAAPLWLESREADQLSDRLAAPPPISAESLAQASLSARLRNALLHLEPTEQRVLTLRFGLFDGIAHDYYEVARIVFGRRGQRVDERIRQIEKQAISTLYRLLQTTERES